MKPYSYQQVIKTLGKFGFQVIRQRGSHIVLKGYCNGAKRTVVVPKHKEIAVGTLKGILFQAGISIDQFLEAV
jgi:predicted RNA binding protein YcfA (HicA-like mRNA interferase family)